MRNVIVVKQPIFDRRLQVVGYELSGPKGKAKPREMLDPQAASSAVIANAFIHIGIDTLVGSAQVFVDLPEQSILDRSLMPMFPKQSVIEVLSKVQPTSQVMEALRRLKARGFAVAVDYPAGEPLVGVADFVRVDLRAIPPDGLGRQVEALKQLDRRLVAEQVESREAFEHCRELGFDLFQGHHLARAETVRERTLPANRAVLQALLRRLEGPEPRSCELAAILAGDVAVCYKLLRYTNGAAFAGRREVDSLEQAISLLSRKALKAWVTALLPTATDASPKAELSWQAVVRAKACELLAKAKQPQLRSQMFTTGLFSILEGLMEEPMVDLLDHLPLTAGVKMALLEKEGRQGELLREVLLAESSGAPDSSYAEAVRWAEGVREPGSETCPEAGFTATVCS